MKTSYILATNKDLGFCQDTILSILRLPKHDMEFLICCPETAVRPEYQEFLDKFNIKIVIDKELSGSIHGFNHPYKFTDGDYICMVCDDVIFPANYLDMQDWMQSDFMKKKRFKISNTLWDAGPGLLMYGHNDKVNAPDGAVRWPISAPHLCINPAYTPYAVIPLPFLARETVEKELQGYLFHPKIKHHFPDHWLGFYVSKLETFEPFTWRCPTIEYQINTKFSFPYDWKTNDYDMKVVAQLAEDFMAGKQMYVNPD